jgi:uncharacterized protein YbjT (DUF2867 family)
LPAAVEIVAGDLTVPESLDAALQDVSAMFLVWTAPPASARRNANSKGSRAKATIRRRAPGTRHLLLCAIRADAKALKRVNCRLPNKDQS